MTTKPKRPHADTLSRYKLLIGDLAREESAAALFFPKLCESAIRGKLAARAAGLKYQRSDSIVAGVIQRCANDPRALLMWIRRNNRLVKQLITAAQMKSPSASAHDEGQVSIDHFRGRATDDFDHSRKCGQFPNSSRV